MSAPREKPCLHKQAEHQHGDYARYRLDGCRCYLCAAAVSRYNEAREKAITAGTWQPFVPLAPVQEHVLLLKALGLGDRSIADRAGLDRKQIRDIASGIRHDPARGNPPLSKVRSETANAILAIPADESVLPGAVIIDAEPTWRKIEQLLEAGLTRARIATEGLGVHRPQLQLDPDRVTVRNARAIDALYRRVVDSSGLDDQGNEDAGEASDGLDWVLVERALRGDPVTLTRHERPAMVQALAAHGLTVTTIGERLRMSSTRVRELLPAGGVA